MEEIQNKSQLSWIEVQFLKKAVEVLLKSRATLTWTYCFAFYLERNNMTQLFEDNQRDLEMAVESLSELLENPLTPEAIPELRKHVLDKTAYVSNRLETLLTDCHQGLQESRWVYIS
jgi:ariadne-1